MVNFIVTPTDALHMVTMVVSDYDLLTTTWLFHCLPDSAWATTNWAEIAEQQSVL